MQPAEGFARIVTIMNQSDSEVFLRYVKVRSRPQPPPQRSWQEASHVRGTPNRHQHPGSDSAAGAAQATWRQDRRSGQWTEPAALNGHNPRRISSPQAAVQISHNSNGHSPSSVNGGFPEEGHMNGRPSVSSRPSAKAQHHRSSAGAGKHSAGIQHGGSALLNARQTANIALPAIDVPASSVK